MTDPLGHIKAVLRSNLPPAEVSTFKDEELRGLIASGWDSELALRQAHITDFDRAGLRPGRAAVLAFAFGELATRTLPQFE